MLPQGLAAGRGKHAGSIRLKLFHRGFQDVGFPNKISDKLAPGCAVNQFRRIKLLNHAVVHHRDSV